MAERCCNHPQDVPKDNRAVYELQRILDLAKADHAEPLSISAFQLLLAEMREDRIDDEQLTLSIQLIDMLTSRESYANAIIERSILSSPRMPSLLYLQSLTRHRKENILFYAIKILGNICRSKRDAMLFQPPEFHPFSAVLAAVESPEASIGHRAMCLQLLNTFLSEELPLPHTFYSHQGAISSAVNKVVMPLVGLAPAAGGGAGAGAAVEQATEAVPAVTVAPPLLLTFHAAKVVGTLIQKYERFSSDRQRQYESLFLRLVELLDPSPPSGVPPHEDKDLRLRHQVAVEALRVVDIIRQTSSSYLISVHQSVLMTNLSVLLFKAERLNDLQTPAAVMTMLTHITSAPKFRPQTLRLATELAGCTDVVRRITHTFPWSPASTFHTPTAVRLLHIIVILCNVESYDDVKWCMDQNFVAALVAAIRVGQLDISLPAFGALEKLRERVLAASRAVFPNSVLIVVTLFRELSQHRYTDALRALLITARTWDPPLTPAELAELETKVTRIADGWEARHAEWREAYADELEEQRQRS